MAGDKNKLTEKQRQILEYFKQEILQRDRKSTRLNSSHNA